MNASLSLDSGFFLTIGPACVEIGCYRNGGPLTDIRLYVDGEQRELEVPIKLGESERIVEVRHRRADGSLHTAGVVEAVSLGHLTGLRNIYEEEIEVDRSLFDCILRLQSGHLRGSIIKRRVFIETQRMADGSFMPTGKIRELSAICHNVVVYFDLDRGDSLVLASGESVLISTGELGVKACVDIEFAWDDDAGQRIYCEPIRTPRQIYWFPDGCNEGPSGPYPPCRL